MNPINDTVLKADPLDEAALRHAVLGALRAELGKNANSLIIEELGLRHGSARIDIAVIGTSIHGVELKSNNDTLERLSDQATVYNAVLEGVTLVVGDCLLGPAIDVIPTWWGLKVAFHGHGGEVCLVDVRNAGRNPSLDKVALAELLWRDEALALLQDLEEDRGLRSKPRRELYEHLASILDLDRLLHLVTEAVRGRVGWRFGEQRMLRGG